MASQTAVLGASAPVREQPPASLVGPWAWARRNLFGSWWSSAVTILLGYLLVRWAWGFFSWAVLHAVWSVPVAANPLETAIPCRQVQGVGACWAVIGDKWRFILFGSYPYNMQWRPALAVLLFIGLYAVSANRKFWRKELLYIWIVTLAVIALLMWGGVLGMDYVAQDQWGGLPITLILATFGLAFAFPLAVVVALGRRSTQLPAVKVL